MANFDTATRNGMQRTMIAPVETIIPKSEFWSEYMAQGGSENLPTRYVEWDYFATGAPMAHFVGEGLTPPPTERKKFQTAQIECPLYRYRKVLGLQDLQQRLPGEPYGSMPAEMFKSIQERAGVLEFEDDVEGVNAVYALRTKIMCDFLFKGLVNVKGYGVDRIIDYDLPHKFVLNAGEQWGDVGVDPIKDLRTWCELLEDFGFNPIEVFMGRKVWQVLEDNERWMAQLDNMRTEKGRFAPEKAAMYGNPQYQATMRDPFLDIYTQRSKYWDDVQKQMVSHLPDNTLIIVTEESKRNRFVHGALDFMENGQYRTVTGEFFKERWHDDRAATSELIFTSRAVPIPGNVHSWVVATVL